MRWSWQLTWIHRTTVWSTAMFILSCMSALGFPPSSTCECLSQHLPISSTNSYYSMASTWFHIASFWMDTFLTKHDIQVCLDVDTDSASGLHGVHLHHPDVACLPLLWKPGQVHGQLSGGNIGGRLYPTSGVPTYLHTVPTSILAWCVLIIAINQDELGKAAKETEQETEARALLGELFEIYYDNRLTQ